jgi:2-dehydropantoate 2-reductase
MSTEIAQGGALLRLLSFGAGAIGTYIGGSLALNGHTLVFLERPEVAAELRQRGLRLDLLGQENVLPQPKVAASLEEALAWGPFDAALFALKSYDTAPALEGLRPYRDRLPPIICLQNGVENEPTIAGLLGAQNVIAGSVTSAIGRRAAGDIVLERLRGLGLAGSHPLAPRAVEAMQQAGLNAHLYANGPALKWTKLLTNLLANAASAILGMTPDEIFAHPGLARLEIAQLREALVVMRSLGLPVVKLPATPARLLAFSVRYLPVGLSRPFLRRAVGGGRGGKMPSFYIDLHSGRGQSEVDYLNGAVVRAGERLGLPTPVNRLLNETLLQLTNGELPLQTFDHQPEKLLEWL